MSSLRTLVQLDIVVGLTDAANGTIAKLAQAQQSAVPALTLHQEAGRATRLLPVSTVKQEQEPLQDALQGHTSRMPDSLAASNALQGISLATPA